MPNPKPYDSVKQTKKASTYGSGGNKVPKGPVTDKAAGSKGPMDRPHFYTSKKV
jgi:hypothetical protein